MVACIAGILLHGDMRHLRHFANACTAHTLADVIAFTVTETLLPADVDTDRSRCAQSG